MKYPEVQANAAVALAALSGLAYQIALEGTKFVERPERSGTA
jgi:hypothetical protein